MAKGFLRSVQKAERPFHPNIMFDVGANVGLMTAHMVEKYPKTVVYAFEPAPSTNETLQKRFQGSTNVKIFQIALDATEGSAEFTNKPLSTGNRIVKSANADNERTVSVEKATGDSFCARHALDHIDFLKIDTEGFDMNVLVGFASMLKAGRIQYVQVECTTSYDNHFHVNLEKFMQFLHPLGYRLYGLFDYSRYIYRTKQEMNGIWFCNAVFVRELENARLRTDGDNYV